MDKKKRVQYIVSVSRRTDIPAFYGSWFMEQVRRGEVDVLHPNKIKKARCIDADLLARLFGLDIANYKIRPTRSQCGCFESIDIGTYNTCQHYCIYCYASHRTHAHVSEELTDSTLKYDSVLNTHKEVRSSSEKMQHVQLSFNFLK